MEPQFSPDAIPLLTSALRASSDAVVLLDSDGRVLVSNPAARALLQAECSDTLSPALCAVLDQVGQVQGEVRAEVDIGEQTYLATVVALTGRGTVLTLRDVTHFRQLARLKDEFIATVSHDLRTPLSAILGYAELARQEGTPEQTRERMLERIEATAGTMAALVNDLLDLATLGAGVPLKACPVALDEMARAAVADLQGVALEKSVTLQCESDGHSLAKADPRLVARLWHSLIDNAVQHTVEGTVTVRVWAEANRIVGQVADTGTGIPPDDLPYIFDKFYRGKRPTTDKPVGTGLGLSLARSIVEKHGGQIWVESEPGVGSTFTFALPPCDPEGGEGETT